MTVGTGEGTETQMAAPPDASLWGFAGNATAIASLSRNHHHHRHRSSGSGFRIAWAIIVNPTTGIPAKPEVYP